MDRSAPAGKTYAYILGATVAAVVVLLAVGLYALLIYRERATFNLGVITSVGAVILALANQVSIVLLGKGQAGTEGKLNRYNGTVAKKVEANAERLNRTDKKVEEANEIVRNILDTSGGWVVQLNERFDRIKELLREENTPDER